MIAPHEKRALEARQRRRDTVLTIATFAAMTIALSVLIVGVIVHPDVFTLP